MTDTSASAQFTVRPAWPVLFQTLLFYTRSMVNQEVYRHFEVAIMIETPNPFRSPWSPCLIIFPKT